MNFFHCNLFQEISNLIRHYRLFFQIEMNFHGQLLLQGFREKEFDIPSQFLKYSDPLLEIASFLQSVLVFLLSGHLEVEPTRIIFLPAREYMVTFLVEPELVSP